MKPITKERIIAAHEKIDAYREYLTGADRKILHTFACYGLNKMAKKSVGLDTTFDSQKATLEMHLNEITPQKKEMIMSRLMKNIDRIHKKRDKVKAIQLAHNISALKRGVSYLSEGSLAIRDGSIEHWMPDENADFWFTDDDLDLLRSESLKIAIFWADYVNLNNLRVFQNIEGEWLPSTTESAILESKALDWCRFNEHMSYQKVNYDKPVRLLGSEEIHGYQIDTSPCPKGGFSKNHEVNFLLGAGKYWDDPEKSAYFCATNKKQPSN